VQKPASQETRPGAEAIDKIAGSAAMERWVASVSFERKDAPRRKA
jgi:hypothetical protein